MMTSKKKGRNRVTNNNDEEPNLMLGTENDNFPRSSRFQPDSNVKPEFVGSMSILLAVVDAINSEIFCHNLDDIELEWCDKMVTRKAVTYKIVSLTTTKTYIRLSKTLFEGGTRKELVETVLYEMLHLYLTAQAPHTSTENDLQVFLLLNGIYYLNKAFDMDLKINHNFDVARIDKRSEGGANGNSNVKNQKEVKLLLKVLRGSTVDQRGMLATFKQDPTIRILNTKLVVKNQDRFECKKNCGICNCKPQLIFRDRFMGTRIFAIFGINTDSFNCILCKFEVERKRSNEHFENECIVFKVSQVIHDKLNV